MEKPITLNRNMSQPRPESMSRWTAAKEKLGRKVGVAAAAGALLMTAACGGPQTSGGDPIHYELDYTKSARTAEALQRDADMVTTKARMVVELAENALRSGKTRHRNGSGENVWSNSGDSKQKGIDASIAYDSRKTDTIRVSYSDTIDGQQNRLSAVVLVTGAKPAKVWDMSEADFVAKSVSATAPGMLDAKVDVSFSKLDDPTSAVENVSTNNAAWADGNTPDTAVSNELKRFQEVYEPLHDAA